MACKQENKKKFCPHAGSNYRPSVYKTDALPLSYRGHLVLPISHNLNNATFFFLTHYYSALLFTTTIKFARARELELKIQNKHRNTQFPSLSLSQWKTKTTPSILYSPNPQQIPIPLSFHFHYFLFIYNNFVYVSGSDSRYFQASLDTKSPRFEKSPFSLQIHHLLQFMFVKSFSNFGFLFLFFGCFHFQSENETTSLMLWTARYANCSICILGLRFFYFIFRLKFILFVCSET